MRGFDGKMLQNAIPSNVQLLQVWARGGAEVSRQKSVKFAVLPYLFHRAAPGMVLAPHILALEGGRLSTSKNEWYYRTFLAPSAPSLFPGLKN